MWHSPSIWTYPGTSLPSNDFRHLGQTLILAAGIALISFAFAGSALAQDWGESDDDWYQSSRPAPSANGPSTGWSLRAGVGFIDDPSALLLNFELPYAFDQWVSAGPMLQVGTSNHNTIVAPTLNVTAKIADLPGEVFDRLIPFGFVGMGFAYIEDDNRANDNSSAGFLVDFGFGVELKISEHFFIGTQMMFNFLPEKTLEEDFFYSWQVGSVRIAF